jgi:hypothetical protein
MDEDGRSHGLCSSTVLEYTWTERDENHEQKLVRMDMDPCLRNSVL